jgi:hypothetical protein
MRIEVWPAENGYIVLQQRTREGLPARWVFEWHLDNPEEKKAVKKIAVEWAMKLLEEELL